MTSFDSEKRRLTGRNITDALGRGLDLGLEPYIKAINQNPDLYTASSCSGMSFQGHGGQGHPYVDLVFRDRGIRDYYEHRLRATGYQISLRNNNTTYVEIPNTTTLALKQNLKVDPDARAKELRKYEPSEEQVRRIMKYQYEDAMKGRLASPQECRQFWHAVIEILRPA